MSLNHPGIGNPCNGCGLCCKAVVCSTGSFTLGLVKEFGERAEGPCPALKSMDDGSLACGLVLRPKDYQSGPAHDLRKAVKVLIGSGLGCDEYDPNDPLSDQKLKDMQSRVDREKINAAFKKWFLNE